MTSLSQLRQRPRGVEHAHVLGMLWGLAVGLVVGIVIASTVWRDLSSCQRASVLVEACRQSRGYEVLSCTGSVTDE